MEERLKTVDAWCQVFVLGLWLLITVPFILPVLLLTRFLAKIEQRLRKQGLIAEAERILRGNR